MSLFSEVVADVYSITGRPDRVAETALAVKAATLKMHQSDFYFRDLFESGVRFTDVSFVQSLEYKVLLPRWRQIKYLRKYDEATNTPGKFLIGLLPEEVLDGYKIQKQDIFYSAGEFVHINSSTQTTTYLLGAYLHPDITEAGYNSWIAADHKYAIVYDAAATVFKAIGKDEEAASYRTLVPEQIALIKASNISPTGF